MSSISLITFQERCGWRKRNSEDKKQNSAIGKFAEACVHSWLRRIHFLHPLFSSFSSFLLEILKNLQVVISE